jgi:hypothetical protein
MAAATAQTLAASNELWARMSATDLDAAWAKILPRLVTAVISGQLLAVAGADDFVQAALAEQGTKAPASGELASAAFAGVGGDGYPVSGQLFGAVTWTKQQIGAGHSPEQALESGRSRLALLASTAVQDAGRAAVATAMAARPKVTGYVRTLSPPSCSRCAILAGRWYRWNASFDRHPRCDCGATPAGEDASELRTSPKAYFATLTATDQDRLFTAAGAEAIRSGADIGQVVNARRGMQTATAYGRALTTTTEGITKRGSFGALERARVSAITGEDPSGIRLKTPRLMPESIFAIAGDDRAKAISLLRRFGYLG